MEAKPTIRELEEILAGDGGAIVLNPDGSIIVVPNVIKEIADERQRQIAIEGWTPDHDDNHPAGIMAKAASCYSLCAGVGLATLEGSEEHYEFRDEYQSASVPRPLWPWADGWWKPKDPRRDMIRAAALLVAEIERIDRSALSCVEQTGKRDEALTGPEQEAKP